MPNLTCLEDHLWVVEQKTGLAKYDFDLSTYFSCKHPAWLDAPVRAIARMGAAPDYAERFESLEALGITLVHTPEEYLLTSTLPRWYPLLEAWTPRSYWFDEHPTAEQIERHLDYPLFLKGERQTNKHDRAQSIIESPSQLRGVLDAWRSSSILHWQRVVAREFLSLRPVAKDHGAGLPRVFEFRTFWWESTCVGIGPYWSDASYALTDTERDGLLEVGELAARALDVTFLVLDIAQTTDGEWIIIEANDGQDSGYMGVDRRQMWRRILDLTSPT